MAYQTSSCASAESSGHSNLVGTARGGISTSATSVTTESLSHSVLSQSMSLRKRLDNLFNRLQQAVPQPVDLGNNINQLGDSINTALEVAGKELSGADETLSFIESYLF